MKAFTICYLTMVLTVVMSIHQETKITIPLDSEFKGHLYQINPDQMISVTYSTVDSVNTLIMPFNETAFNNESSLPNEQGLFSFIPNVNVTNSSKVFFLNYNSVQPLKDTNAPIEGVIALNNEVTQTNFINQLHEQNIIQSSHFSFYYSLNNSQLFLGDFSTGTNISAIFNKLSYCQSQTTNWESQISSINLQSRQYKLYSSIIIDTSANDITIPQSDYKLLNKYYFGEHNCILTPINAIKCKCTSPSLYTPIKLTLDNQEHFIINPEDLVEYFPNDEYQCQWKVIVNRENLSNWIIGRPGLLNSFYSFDLKTKRFGFMQDVTKINNFIKEDVLINEDKEETSYSDKLGWVITLIIICLIMWAVFKFATNDDFLDKLRKKRNSLDMNDKNDRNHILSISEHFQKEDDNLMNKKETLVEMKEMLIEKK